MRKSRAAATLFGLLVLTGALGPSAGASPPDPFHGAWKSIDTVDDSNQTMSFGGGGTTRRVTLFDDDATVACATGGPATARGSGEVSGDTLTGQFDLIRCADGTTQNDIGFEFTYDPGTDTLSDSFGVVWNRP